MEIAQQETSLHQVRLCVEIGITCMDANPENRRDTKYIMDKLKELESSYEFSEGGLAEIKLNFFIWGSFGDVISGDTLAC